MAQFFTSVLALSAKRRAFSKLSRAGRNSAIKGLDAAGIKITMLVDRTPIPHNGCRPRKIPRK